VGLGDGWSEERTRASWRGARVRENGLRLKDSLKFASCMFSCCVCSGDLSIAMGDEKGMRWDGDF
jgi:hypothetical protein